MVLLTPYGLLCHVRQCRTFPKLYKYIILTIITHPLPCLSSVAPSPTDRPSALLGDTLVQGISHPYAALSKAEKRNYTLHFVRFAGLKPRETYVIMVIYVYSLISTSCGSPASSLERRT